jgi:hypothetical protein
MCYLYRGVSEEHHARTEGRLVPAGSNSEIVMTRGDYSQGVKMLRNGEFIRCSSETNTVRAHHLKSGFRDGCFISTTREFERAVFFATVGGAVDGYVYVIDPSKFCALGVVEREFPDPRYPDEKEVSIRAADNGEVPREVIIEIREVKSSDYEA